MNEAGGSTMKAVTLHQPWASLIALGVKTIETRSWEISHRGPIAIHAAKRRPDFKVMSDLVAKNADVWDKWWNAGLVSDNGELDFLPLGAVVATANLVDCLPMIEVDDVHISDPEQWIEIEDGDAALWTNGPDRNDIQYLGQLETRYGDFAPGRWAWILEDIQPLPQPIAAKGKQRLWNWEGAL